MAQYPNKYFDSFYRTFFDCPRLFNNSDHIGWSSKTISDDKLNYVLLSPTDWVGASLDNLLNDTKPSK